MGLGTREFAHRTAAAQHTAVASEELWDYKPGQRVMTVDGYPGRVVAVNDGPFQGSEDYQVVLDNDLGGGLYTSGQLRPIGAATASEHHTAAEDYPELGSILIDRPDIAPNTVLASKTAHLDEDYYQHALHDYGSDAGHNDALESGDETPEEHAADGHKHCEFCGSTSHDENGHTQWDDEPSEEDGYISHDRDGISVSHGGKHVGTFPNYARAEHALHHEMDASGYYPNVWVGGEHGPGERPVDASFHENFNRDFPDSGAAGMAGRAHENAEHRVFDIPQNEDHTQHYIEHHRHSEVWTNGDQDQRDPRNPSEAHEYHEGDHAEHDCDEPGCHWSALGHSHPRDQFDNPPEYEYAPREPEHVRQRHIQAPPAGARPVPTAPAYDPLDYDRLDEHAHEVHRRGQEELQRWQHAPGYTPSEPDYGDTADASGRNYEHEDPFSWRHAALGVWGLIAMAAVDPDLRFHVTASWSDVVAKAKRLRAEGHVNVIAANAIQVAANVKGDHHVYQTVLMRATGSRTAVASWECGCKWAAYSWGRRGRWRKFEGRMCSHALALQYEAQSRGMFGAAVNEDKTTPDWLRPRTRVVVQYDRDTQRNHSRPAQPRKRDVGRTYTGAAIDPIEYAPEYPVVSYLVAEAIAAGEGHEETAFMLRTAGIKIAEVQHLAKPKHRHHERGRGSVMPMPWFHGGVPCGQCGGAGCGHCEGTGVASPDGDGDADDAGATTGTTAVVFHEDEVTPNLVNPPVPQVVPWTATQPRDPQANPASTGPLSGPDPDGFNHGSNALYTAALDEALFEPDLSAEAAFLALAPELIGAGEAAAGAGEAAGAAGAAEEGGGMGNALTHNLMPGGGGQHADPTEQGNSADQRMDQGAPSLAGTAGLAELHEEPEPALPSTDGAEEDGEGVEAIVARFQATAGAHIMGGDGGAAGAVGDIAAAAKMFLATGQKPEPMQTTALKNFSAAEQAELINEGLDVRASNLDRLEIAGTHYEALDAALAAEDEEGWLA